MAKRQKGVVPPHLVGKNFQKGDPRINRNGAPKKVVRLRRMINAMLGVPKDVEVSDEALSKSEMGLIFEALIMNAKRGDVSSAREILNRAYGLPKQTISVEQEPDEPEDDEVDYSKLSDEVLEQIKEAKKK